MTLYAIDNNLLHGLDAIQLWSQSMIGTQKISPYYQNLLDSLGVDHPLRRTVYAEFPASCGAGELDDPLGEEARSPAPGIVHTYPDKALLLATSECAVHCRYCTRGRRIGRGGNEADPLPEEAVAYLQSNREIRDVLVSGGDPLLLPAATLNQLFTRLRSIAHLRTIRLGTKLPAVDPERVTPDHARVLAAHRVWVQLHVIHPDELTPAFDAACDRLAAAGVPMVSQTVLLQGINDDADLLADLFYGLLERRVKPYYLFQCDPVTGSASFRTSLEKGLSLVRSLQGQLSGLAMPHFAVDAPGGGGKIELLPDTPLRREGATVFIKGPDGAEYSYPDSG